MGRFTCHAVKKNLIDLLGACGMTQSIMGWKKDILSTNLNKYLEITYCKNSRRNREKTQVARGFLEYFTKCHVLLRDVNGVSTGMSMERIFEIKKVNP
jgi:hypothetical protein